MVLLSQDEASEVQMMFIVAPASTDVSGICVEVRVGTNEGLPRGGVLRALCHGRGRVDTGQRAELRSQHVFGDVLQPGQRLLA